MSRSYKKSPVYTDGRTPGPKISKRFAAKKVRNTDWDELPLKGCGYKKVFCSYDIHDYISRYTIEDARRVWEDDLRSVELGIYSYEVSDHAKYGTFENFLNKWWKKWYYRK